MKNLSLQTLNFIILFLSQLEKENQNLNKENQNLSKRLAVIEGVGELERSSK